MMKVLLLNDIIAPYGGAETYTIELAKLLTRQGLEVHILAAKGHVDPQAVPPRTRIITYDYQVALRSWRLCLPRLPSMLAEKLAKLFSKYSIVHSNNTILNAYMKQIESSIPPDKRPIFIRTVHDYREVCPTLWKINNNKPCPYNKPGIHCIPCHPQLWHQATIEDIPLHSLLKTLAKNARNLKRSKQLLENAEHYDAIIAPSKYLAKLLQQKLKNPRIIHLYNFAPNSAQQSLESLEKREEVLLYVGRLSLEKGVHLIPIIAKELQRELSTLKIIVAGKGPLFKTLQYQVRKYNLNNLKLAGYVDEQTKQRLLRTSKALVFPSIWCENHPITITEAFQAALPIITFDIGGQGELVRESQGGIATPYLNLKAYTKAIIDLAINDTLWQRLSRRASKFAKENFDVENYVDTLIDVYHYCHDMEKKLK